MVRKIIAIMLSAVMLTCCTYTLAYGAAGCTVYYYFTSQQNPEPVPKPTMGTQSGSVWKIKPAGPVKTVYRKDKNGQTKAYTFDGWYTNINCMGDRYLPGKETTALVPVKASGKYTVKLYGRWVYSERQAGDDPKNITTQTAEAPADTSSAGRETESESVRKQADSASDTKTPTANSEKPGAGNRMQTITSITALTFADKGQTRGLNASTSSGLKLEFASDDPNIAAVDQNGTIKSVAAGSTVIRIKQSGNAQYEPAETAVNVTVAGYRSREEALAVWRHLLIDTFFHLNGRKYSFASPGRYWKDSKGAWSGKTGRNGSTQSCITLPTVSLKRTGIISPNSGNIWLTSNMASSPNRTVRRLKRTSSMLHITYPHKSLKKMAASGQVKYGDILCRSGHTYVYMGKNSEGRPLVYESGTRRDIGNGTGVTWGHHSGGHANKLTGKINKQIKKSKAIGEKWRSGQISDAAFRGHKASGKNLNKAVHIVCSIRTFTVRTSCINGTITTGNTYMAGQNVNVKYAPTAGKSLDYVEVDGKKADSMKYGSEYTFSRISADHSINVVYK